MVEVSSYQAADVTRRPGVVVLTSLAPDHLDWHGGVEAYYRDKLRLVEAGPPGRLAVSAGSAEALAGPRATRTGRCSVPRAGCGSTVDGWIEVDGTDLVDSGPAADPRPSQRLEPVRCGRRCPAGDRSAPVDRRRWSGRRRVRRTAVPVPVLGERDGRTYVDDALASNPFASAASVETFAGRPLTVIVGGADRGVDPGPLVDALAAHRPAASVVVLPPEPDRLVGSWSARWARCRSGGRRLAEAVELADGSDRTGRRGPLLPGGTDPRRRRRLPVRAAGRSPRRPGCRCGVTDRVHPVGRSAG